MNTTYKNRERLNAKEQLFVNEYISNLDLEENERIKKACELSGTKRSVFKHEAVQNEIAKRLQSIQEHAIMSAREILEMYSSVARGEVLDQFGLDASLDTRLKALDSLAKRIVDTKEQDNKFEIHLIRE